MQDSIVDILGSDGMGGQPWKGKLGKGNLKALSIPSPALYPPSVGPAGSMRACGEINEDAGANAFDDTCLILAWEALCHPRYEAEDMCVPRQDNAAPTAGLRADSMSDLEREIA
jgi:hypothetical protein